MNPFVKSFFFLLGGGLFVAIFLLVTFPITMLWSRVFMDGWNWFVVPVGAPVITYWPALGVSLMISLILAKAMPTPKRPDDEDIWAWAIKGLANSLIFSLIAWAEMAAVHHLFFPPPHA